MKVWGARVLEVCQFGRRFHARDATTELPENFPLSGDAMVTAVLWAMSGDTRTVIRAPGDWPKVHGSLAERIDESVYAD